jgi:hypothetical protein
VRVGATAPTSGLAAADLVTDGVGLRDMGVLVGDGESDIDFVFDAVLLGDEPGGMLAETDGDTVAESETTGVVPAVGVDEAESDTTGVVSGEKLAVGLAVTSVASGASDALGDASLGSGDAEGVMEADDVGVSVPFGPPGVAVGLSDASGEGAGESDGSGVGDGEAGEVGEGVSVSVPVGVGEGVGLSEAAGETVIAEDAVVVEDGESVSLGEGISLGEGEVEGVMLSLAPGERLGVSLGDTVGVPEDVPDGDPLGVGDSDVVVDGVGDAETVVVGVTEGEGVRLGDGLGTPTWHEFTLGPLLPSASVQPRSTWLLPTEAVAQLSSRYWLVEKPPAASHVAAIDAPAMPGAGRHTSACTTCTESGVLAPLTVAHVSSLS